MVYRNLFALSKSCNKPKKSINKLIPVVMNFFCIPTEK